MLKYILELVASFIEHLLSQTPTPKPPPAQNPPSNPPPGRPSPRDPDKEQDLLGAVNVLRNGSGMPPVVLDDLLTEAAQSHARFMADKQVLSHTGLNGSSVADRVDAAGYKWNSVGECVASGYTHADATIAAWADSPGHRRIMIGDYKHVGFGYATSDRPYWVAVFAKPSSGGSSPRIVELGLGDDSNLR